MTSTPDSHGSSLTAQAERGVFTRLPGCGSQLTASALLDGGLLFLTAEVTSPDGTRRLTASHALYPEDSRDPAGELAERVADELREAGAEALARGEGSAP